MRIPKPSNHWATPTDLYDKLQDLYGFEAEFDPCPFNCDLALFNGLKASWPNRTFCNPPYSTTGKSDFVHKALWESEHGKLTILLLPVSTSTVLFHKVIKPYASKIEFLDYRPKFEGVNTRGEWANPWTARIPAEARESLNIDHESTRKKVTSGGAHDSMLVFFGEL